MRRILRTRRVLVFRENELGWMEGGTHRTFTTVIWYVRSSCTGTAGIAVRQGLFAVAATRGDFSAVSARPGHRGKISPRFRGRKQTPPDCNSVVHGIWCG